MSPTVIMLLGRSVWKREPGRWHRESFDGTQDAASAANSRLVVLLSGNPAPRTMLIYQPEGMAHQSVETPRVSRRVFASLSRIRSEYAVVESETLGWGIESPEAAQGGGFSTLMHCEMTPGLVTVQESCSGKACRPLAAWSAFTAAVACAKAIVPAARARFVLILLPDFVAVATCVPGKRAFKAWSGPMSERDWKAFSLLIGDTDARSPAALADPGLRRAGIAVIVAGEPGRVCPVWGEIQASGRVAAVMDMDALAAGVARIPKSHPANLAEAFPTPRNLDSFLVGAASIGLLGVLTLGALVIGGRKQLSQEVAAERERAAVLDDRLEALTRNREEMKVLQAEVPADPAVLKVSRHRALVGLSTAVPDAVTLTSLAIGKDNGFEMQAVVIGAGVDMDDLRRALERLGFEPDAHDGWVYNAAAGRLAIRGKLGDSRS